MNPPDLPAVRHAKSKSRRRKNRRGKKKTGGSGSSSSSQDYASASSNNCSPEGTVNGTSEPAVGMKTRSKSHCLQTPAKKSVTIQDEFTAESEGAIVFPRTPIPASVRTSRRRSTRYGRDSGGEEKTDDAEIVSIKKNGKRSEGNISTVSVSEKAIEEPTSINKRKSLRYKRGLDIGKETDKVESDSTETAGCEENARNSLVVEESAERNCPVRDKAGDTNVKIGAKKKTRFSKKNIRKFKNLKRTKKIKKLSGDVENESVSLADTILFEHYDQYPLLESWTPNGWKIEKIDRTQNVEDDLLLEEPVNGTFSLPNEDRSNSSLRTNKKHDKTLNSVNDESVCIAETFLANNSNIENSVSVNRMKSVASLIHEESDINSKFLQTDGKQPETARRDTFSVDKMISFSEVGKRSSRKILKAKRHIVPKTEVSLSDTFMREQLKGFDESGIDVLNSTTIREPADVSIIEKSLVALKKRAHNIVNSPARAGTPGAGKNLVKAKTLSATKTGGTTETVESIRKRLKTMSDTAQNIVESPRRSGLGSSKILSIPSNGKQQQTGLQFANNLRISKVFSPTIANKIKAQIRDLEDSAAEIPIRIESSQSLVSGILKTESMVKTPRTKNKVMFKNVSNGKENVPVNIKKTPQKKTNGTPKRTNMPDFGAIHQKAFNKMESLDEYAQRKERRAKQLLSGEKAPKPKPVVPPNSNRPFHTEVPNRFEFGNVKDKRFVSKMEQVKTPERKALKDQREMLKTKEVRKEKMKTTLNKVPVINKEQRIDTKRECMKGVRTNRRFELLMQMRKLKQ